MSRRGIVGRAVLGLLCLICFGWGRMLALEPSRIPECRVMSGMELTGRRARAMLEAESRQEEPLAFTAWGQLQDAEVSEPLLDRRARVSVLLLAGGSELVYGSDAPLAAGDPDGCLIDSGTAAALFGSLAPGGSSVEWNGRTLTVRGVLKGSRPLLAVQALDNDGGLDHISLRLPEGQSAGLVCGGFGDRHALYGSWTDPGAFGSLAEAASLLPALVMLGYALAKIVKAAFAAAEYPVVFLVCLLAAGAVWTAGLLATELSMGIPAELLPAKWSDFDFWGRLWESKREELLNTLAAPKTEPELYRLVPALLACAAGLTGSLLAACVLAWVRPRSWGGLWLCCAVCLVVSFALSLLTGGTLARDRALWLSPTLCLGARMAADRLAGWAAATTGRDPP